ncbi:uncharacterized protein LACBIDRAFT_332125 [Laccaria bicolor S238N-H82]|uniref:Predicted protein n=1 Tax=Laccaria bicolor (strain S238N-H82 / ATCC MYA-4686) TaxID=486041 RepID=B0DRN9_LACBS|nr:uncharacterized protein LACBIDRAFT_332125 [Laccaria bicolor S238N-H82]EDR02820.1 predicted protein [Laccaria bicolor S238N-H82]|eukprot:XP_001886530.1 predicted protein [Laccaria bicolor S238N-H82]
MSTLCGCVYATSKHVVVSVLLLHKLTRRKYALAQRPLCTQPQTSMKTCEAGSSLLDGRGDVELMCGTTPGPRYVYYKLYTKDGALETNRPIYSNDRFISRVLSRSVAPPHTAGSLKLRLRKIEGFEEGDLYLSISEKSHVEDSTRLSLRRQVGPGLSKDDPVALVVSDPEKRQYSQGNSLIVFLPLVYYRIYDQGGQAVSNTAFHEDDTSLGRLEVLSVAPPQTVASLKRRIIKVEGIVNHDCELFGDESGETTMNDDDTISFSADSYPCISEDEPIAVVYQLQKQFAAPPPPTGNTKQLKATSGASLLISMLYGYKLIWKGGLRFYRFINSDNTGYASLI